MQIVHKGEQIVQKTTYIIFSGGKDILYLTFIAAQVKRNMKDI